MFLKIFIAKVSEQPRVKSKSSRIMIWIFWVFFFTKYVWWTLKNNPVLIGFLLWMINLLIFPFPMIGLSFSNHLMNPKLYLVEAQRCRSDISVSENAIDLMDNGFGENFHSENIHMTIFPNLGCKGSSWVSGGTHIVIEVDALGFYKVC